MADNYFRIDDRLIHGQVVTAWRGFWKIREIIAIDDKLASDPVLQKIMIMGVPGDCKAHVVTVYEAKKLFKEENGNNRLFLTRFPETLRCFREELKECKEVVIGNVAKRTDTKYNISVGGGGVFFASDSDIALFDELEKDGVKLIYQTVPNSLRKSWSEIDKHVF